jgi:hypothetical protein
MAEQQTRLSAERLRASRESLKAIGPLLQMLSQDKNAQRATENLRRLREAGAKPKLRFPRVMQRVEQHTRTGSIVDFIAPPYRLVNTITSVQKGTTFGTTVTAQDPPPKGQKFIDARFNATINVGSGGNACPYRSSCAV